MLPDYFLKEKRSAATFDSRPGAHIHRLLAARKPQDVLLGPGLQSHIMSLRRLAAGETRLNSLALFSCHPVAWHATYLHEIYVGMHGMV
jgi:hypothetical protein